MVRIHDAEDGRVARVRALLTRKERDRTGRFWTEGLRFVARAVQGGIPLETLIWVPKMLAHPFGQRLVRQCHQSGVPCCEVTPEVFLRLSRAEEPQWIGAVGRQRWTRMADAPPRAGLCWLALDTVQSPGNLGTILRTCDAVGAAGVILLGPQADPYDPAAIRATMGALFSQRLVRAAWPEFADWKRRHGGLLVGTSPSGAADYREVCYRPPATLWMGWERQGLSAGQQALCDAVARIPMTGRGDSLNLAVATGVMLYEIHRQLSRD
ncbi:MAG: RNA methyltransferase [Armatimonadetes bacterium]|nr:RNA methyltransferase [Armatimonadota bacterium]